MISVPETFRKIATSYHRVHHIDSFVTGKIYLTSVIMLKRSRAKKARDNLYAIRGYKIKITSFFCIFLHFLIVRNISGNVFKTHDVIPSFWLMQPEAVAPVLTRALYVYVNDAYVRACALHVGGPYVCTSALTCVYLFCVRGWCFYERGWRFYDRTSWCNVRLGVNWTTPRVILLSPAVTKSIAHPLVQPTELNFDKVERKRETHHAGDQTLSSQASCLGNRRVKFAHKSSRTLRECPRGNV